MMKSISAVLFCLALVSCKQAEEPKETVRVVEKVAEVEQDGRFSAEGEFVYNIQQAHFKANQVKSLGEVSESDFLAAFEATDWGEQVNQANQRQTVSPSMAIRHNPSSYELGITVVGNSDSDYGFWLYFGKFGSMKSIEVLDEEMVRPKIQEFFGKKFDKLSSEFGVTGNDEE